MSEETGPAPERLRSLDALRGADMFWIIGGSGFVAALADATDWPLLHWITEQCEHVEWNGFRFWDLIFPLFLFVAGVAMPFSLTRRIERGDDRRQLHRHVVYRGLMLVFLGVVYNGLLRFDFDSLRYASVLGRIGLGYLFAALIVMNARVRGQVIWLIGILLGYWAAMSWIPVPGIGAGDLTPGNTLADWIDRQLLPGRLHRTVRDPEGLLSTLPAVGTALLGALAGHWLRRPGASGVHKAAGLGAAGVALLGLGWVWSLAFPLNKNLWTSSFVAWTGGWSCLFLGSFYLVIDVWGYRRWAFPFVVIGMNAITIYLMQAFVDFDAVAALCFGNQPPRVHVAILAGAGLSLRWLLLYVMYRRRIFLRV